MDTAISDPFVSVIVCAYTERRWQQLANAIDSLCRQRRRPDEILLIIDHNSDLLHRARKEFRTVSVVPNEEVRGLAGARNTGVGHSRADILAFLDDDAVADPDWLGRMLEVFEDRDVIGAGGRAEPVWATEAPRWMPSEFLWVVGGSYTGLPRARSPVRNPIGACMAFRRQAFDEVGQFTVGMGRVGTTPLGCEETEFAIRLRQALPQSVIMYVPQARVEHHVAAERATFRYFTARCWAEGASKAMVQALVGASDGLASERSYVTRTLPRGVAAGVLASTRGDAGGVARAGVIVAGLATTIAGYFHARLALARDRRRARGARDAKRHPRYGTGSGWRTRVFSDAASPTDATHSLTGAARPASHRASETLAGGCEKASENAGSPH